MKKFKSLLGQAIAILLIFSVTIATAFGQDSKKNKSDSNTGWAKEKVASRHYTCNVRSVTPSGGRMKQLSPGYTLTVAGDSLISNLPYFGQAYSISGSTGGGFNFISSTIDYSIADRKKGGWDVRIKTKDQQENAEFYLTIFENGSTSIRVNSIHRGAISYEGDLDSK